MKNIKKLLAVLLSLIMLLSCTMTAFASNDTPVLKLEANQYNSNGERHIKVSWEGNSGTYQLQLSDNVDFENATVKKRSSKQGQYYNFVLSENVDETYYIRVRRLTNGEWSNTVIADMEENAIETESTPYFKIPEIPSIPDISQSINWDWLKSFFKD